MSSDINDKALHELSNATPPKVFKNLFQPLNSIKDFEFLSKEDQVKYSFGALLFLSSIFLFFFYSLSLSHELGKTRRNPNPTGVIIRMFIIIGMFVSGLLLMASAVGLMGDNLKMKMFKQKQSNVKDKYILDRVQDVRKSAVATFDGPEGSGKAIQGSSFEVIPNDVILNTKYDKLNTALIDTHGIYQKKNLTQDSAAVETIDRTLFKTDTNNELITYKDCIKYFQKANKGANKSDPFTFFYWFGDGRAAITEANAPVGHCHGVRKSKIQNKFYVSDTKFKKDGSPYGPGDQFYQYVGCVKDGVLLKNQCAPVS